MTITWKDVFDLGQAIFTAVGFGVMLHYYAFAIAWGIRKGQAKIPSQNNTSVILKTDKDL